MIRHWVEVSVQVPIESMNTSPVLAEMEAKRKVETILHQHDSMFGEFPKMVVGFAGWRRQEPAR